MASKFSISRRVNSDVFKRLKLNQNNNADDNLDIQFTILVLKISVCLFWIAGSCILF